MPAFLPAMVRDSSRITVAGAKLEQAGYSACKNPRPISRTARGDQKQDTHPRNQSATRQHGVYNHAVTALDIISGAVAAAAGGATLQLKRSGNSCAKYYWSARNGHTPRPPARPTSLLEQAPQCPMAEEDHPSKHCSARSKAAKYATGLTHHRERPQWPWQSVPY